MTRSSDPPDGFKTCAPDCITPLWCGQNGCVAERLCFACGEPILHDIYYVPDYDTRTEPGNTVHRGGYAQRPHCKPCAVRLLANEETDP